MQTATTGTWHGFRFFYPHCEKDYASNIPARNVNTGTTFYSWPRCPSDCPLFEKVDDFKLSVARDQYEKKEAKGVNCDEVWKTWATSPQQPGTAAAIATAATSPSVPEKVTPSWLWNHVPVSWWGWAAGTVIAVFLAGFAVGTNAGRITMLREWLHLSSPVANEPQQQSARTGVPERASSNTSDIAVPRM